MNARETTAKYHWAAALVAALGRLRGRDGFRHAPDARSYGSAARGRRLIEGRFDLGGARIEAPVGMSIWDLREAGPEAVRAAQGFGWLDDLAAEGGETALALARDWTADWIARFDRAPGRTAQSVAGERLLRWLVHGESLLEDAPRRDRAAFLRSLDRQLRRLARREQPSYGLLAIEARAAVLIGAVCLGRPARRVRIAAARLAAAADATLDPEGAIGSRNPEELATILAHLVDARAALNEVGHPVSPALAEAIARAGSALRTLRHADGGLAGFHGGGRGAPGRLDQSLSGIGDRPLPPPDRAMGFARLAAGRTTLILDAAPPPAGPDATTAHASTLAFELTSGRRPLVVNCGSGVRFGSAWRRAGRATPSHSTLIVDGQSSARLDGVRLVDGPCAVRMERRRRQGATGFVAGHDGYLATHGLTHVRHVFLDDDGRGIAGEDVLATIEREDEAIFERVMDAAVGAGLAFTVRFHLHPEVRAAPGAAPGTVALDLASGERWLFRHEDGRAALTLEPSVCLDGDTPEPRPAWQIVLAARATDYATRLRWTLAKSPETPDAVRNLDHGDGPVLA